MKHTMAPKSGYRALREAICICNIDVMYMHCIFLQCWVLAEWQCQPSYGWSALRTYILLR